MYYINQLDYPEIKYLTRTSLEGEAGEKGKHTTVESLPSIYSGENEKATAHVVALVC